MDLKALLAHFLADIRAGDSSHALALD